MEELEDGVLCVRGLAPPQSTEPPRNPCPPDHPRASHGLPFDSIHSCWRYAGKSRNALAVREPPPGVSTPRKLRYHTASSPAITGRFPPSAVREKCSSSAWKPARSERKPFAPSATTSERARRGAEGRAAADPVPEAGACARARSRFARQPRRSQAAPTKWALQVPRRRAPTRAKPRAALAFSMVSSVDIVFETTTNIVSSGWSPSSARPPAPPGSTFATKRSPPAPEAAVRRSALRRPSPARGRSLRSRG